MTTQPFHDSMLVQIATKLQVQGASIHGWRYVSNCNVTLSYSFPLYPELNLNLPTHDQILKLLPQTNSQTDQNRMEHRLPPR